MYVKVYNEMRSNCDTAGARALKLQNQPTNQPPNHSTEDDVRACRCVVVAVVVVVGGPANSAVSWRASFGVVSRAVAIPMIAVVVTVVVVDVQPVSQLVVEDAFAFQSKSRAEPFPRTHTRSIVRSSD